MMKNKYFTVKVNRWSISILGEFIFGEAVLLGEFAEHSQVVEGGALHLTSDGELCVFVSR